MTKKNIINLPDHHEINFQHIWNCGYSMDHSTETIIYAHYTQIVPWLNKFLDVADPDFYLSLLMYSFHVCGLRCVSSEESYNKWFSSIFPLLQRKVERYKRHINCPPNMRNLPDEGEKIKVGAFFGPKSSATTHMIEVCNYLAQKDKNFEVYTFFLGVENEDPIKHLAAPEIHHQCLTFHWSCSTSFSDEIFNIRRKADEIGLDVSFSALNTIMASILMVLEISPINLNFSHFLHGRLSDFGCQYHMTYGSPALMEQKFGNTKCMVIPSAIKDKQPLKKINITELARKKNEYAKNNEVILSTLGRSAKVFQLDFLNVVAEILRKNTNTIFLYTSDEEVDLVANFFKREMLDGRVRNVGWVDLDEFIPIVDILLDSFPMGNGITLLKNFAYGKPVISMASIFSYFGRDIEPIIDAGQHRKLGLYNNRQAFNALFFENTKYEKIIDELIRTKHDIIIKDKESYIKTAGHLINDPIFRNQIGDLMSSLYKHIYSDTDLMGATFAQHIQNALSVERLAQQKFNKKYLLDALIAPSSIGRCVNKCRFCLQSHPDFYFATHPLETVHSDDKIFLKALSELPDETTKVSVTPYTETLTLTNILPRIREIIAHNRKASFETSGVIYNEDFYRQAMEAGLSRILISVNAPNRELYKKTHGRDNFDRVIKNLKKLISLRNICSPSTELHIHIMLFEEFLEEYSVFYNEWKDKVDCIYLQGLCNWGNDIWRHNDFSDVNLNPVRMQNVERFPCPFITNTLLLHPDGKYYICGMAYKQYIQGKPMGCLGSADEITVMEAWNRLTYYRNMHEQKRWDELECCASCNAWLTWVLYIDSPEFEDGILKLNDLKQ